MLILDMLKTVLVRFALIIFSFGITTPIYLLFPDSGLAILIWFVVSFVLLLWILAKFFGAKIL